MFEYSVLNQNINESSFLELKWVYHPSENSVVHSKSTTCGPNTLSARVRRVFGSLSPSCCEQPARHLAKRVASSSVVVCPEPMPHSECPPRHPSASVAILLLRTLVTQGTGYLGTPSLVRARRALVQ